LKHQAEVCLALSSLQTETLPVVFGGLRPSGTGIIHIPCEEEFPIEQVKKIQKLIDAGRQAKERRQLMGRMYYRIQQECPKFFNIVQTKFDDEQLIDNIHSLLPRFIHEELTQHAQNSDEIVVLVRELCVFLCRQIRVSASPTSIGNADNDEVRVTILDRQHLCNFQVQDLEHFFVESRGSNGAVEDVVYNITLLSVEEIESIINERDHKLSSPSDEVDVQRSLSLIQSLCMNFGDLHTNLLENDQPVLLIGNTGCGKPQASISPAALCVVL
jgi:hypothetical protein